MLPGFHPIFVKVVGKTECILRQKIGVCLMITALNWHAVKDTTADFSLRRGSNHLVLLSSDHLWWSLGAKLIVSAVSRASPFEGKLRHSQSSKRVIQLSSPAREGTVSVQWQFSSSDLKYVLFETVYKTRLADFANKFYFPPHACLYVYCHRAD